MGTLNGYGTPPKVVLSSGNHQVDSMLVDSVGCFAEENSDGVPATKNKANYNDMSGRISFLETQV